MVQEVLLLRIVIYGPWSIVDLINRYHFYTIILNIDLWIKSLVQSSVFNSEPVRQFFRGPYKKHLCAIIFK